MIALLKKLFGKSPKLNGEPSSYFSRGFDSSIQGGSESATHVQLVQVMMRDLIRKSGIPPGWIICYPQVLNSRSRGKGIFVRLSVKHWDDRLMKLAFAFQKTLLHDLVRIEPNAASWLHGIAWQLEVASTCPHTILPERDFWLDAPPAAPLKTATAARPTLVSPIPAILPVTPITTVAALSSLALAAPTVSLMPQAPLLPSASLTSFSSAAATVPSATVVAVASPVEGTSNLSTTANKDDAIEDLLRLFAVRDKELADNGAADAERSAQKISPQELDASVRPPKRLHSDDIPQSQAYERTQPAYLGRN